MLKHPDDVVTLYLAKRKLLLNIARSYLKDEERSVDLVANVIVIMLEKERAFPNENACLYYMKQIVRNGAKNLLRKNSEMLLWEGSEAESLPCGPSAEDPLERVETALFLRGLIEDQPYEIREAFARHVLDGVPSRVLAAELGMEHEALRKRFSRMKKRLSAAAPMKNLLFLLLLSQ